MQKITSATKRFIADEEGLTTVEYAVAGALVIGAIVLAFTNLGGAVAARIDAIRGVIE